MSEVTRALALQMVALDLQIKLAAAEQHWADAHVIAFRVPGEPIPKARARTFTRPGGRTQTVTPQRTKDAEARVRDYLKVTYPGLQPSTAQFGIELRFCFRGAGRGDWDNYSKLICDALNKVVWVDDHQVRTASVRLASNCAEPCTLVEIRELST